MREIFKAFTKTTSGTIVSLVLNAATVKILAVMLGPAAIGLLSLLRQIYNTTLIAATLSGQTALVQGGSARVGEERILYLRTVLVIFLISCATSTIFFLVLAPQLAQWVLNRSDTNAVWLVRLLVLPIVLTVINGFTMGLLNIHRQLGRMAIIQMVAAAFTALLTFPIARLVQAGNELAMVGIVLVVPLMTFGLTLYPLHKMGLLAPLMTSLLRSFDRNMARSFYSFAGTTVITALVQSGIMLLLRSMIVDQAGLAGAGIFDAAWTLSMTYVTLVTTAFGTYYLPTLSALGEKSQRTDLIQQMFRFTTILVTPLIIGVIVLKPFMLHLLFSAEFMPAIALIGWMLIGDYFKLTSWVKAYPMLAFADLKIFFWSEIGFQLFFFIVAAASLIFLRALEGVAIAFVVFYIAHYGAMSIYASRRYGFVASRRVEVSWWVGMLLILLFSLLTWQATEVQWSIIVAAAIAGVAHLLLSLRKEELVAAFLLTSARMRRWQPSH